MFVQVTNFAIHNGTNSPKMLSTGRQQAPVEGIGHFRPSDKDHCAFCHPINLSSSQLRHDPACTSARCTHIVACGLGVIGVIVTDKLDRIRRPDDLRAAV